MDSKKAKEVAKLMQEFIAGTSADHLCESNSLSPTELVELIKKTQMVLPNDLFELELLDKKNMLETEIINELSLELRNIKSLNDEYIKKINDYEVEMRVQKEFIQTLINMTK